MAAKKLKIAVPVVFVGVNGPLELGLISSLARPEGNITGLAITSADLAGKRLQLLREFIPKLRRVAVLWNPENPGNHVQMKAVEVVADVLKIDLQPLSITKPEDLDSAFDRVRRAEALYVVDDPLFVAHRMRIAVLAANARLPTVNGYREMVEAGGMASYGVVLPDLYRRAATYVDKILRGAKPSDLPIEQPVRYELVINGQSLKALGLSVPHAVQVRADEVIQ